MKGLVVLPSYGIPEDKMARRIVRKQIPGSEVVPLDCTELSAEGGALNCVTWNMSSQHSVQ